MGEKLKKARAKINQYLNDYGDMKPSRYCAIVYLLMNGVKPMDAIVVISEAYTDGRLLE